MGKVWLSASQPNRRWYTAPLNEERWIRARQSQRKKTKPVTWTVNYMSAFYLPWDRVNISTFLIKTEDKKQEKPEAFWNNSGTERSTLLLVFSRMPASLLIAMRALLAGYTALWFSAVGSLTEDGFGFSLDTVFAWRCCQSWLSCSPLDILWGAIALTLWSFHLWVPPLSPLHFFMFDCARRVSARSKPNNNKGLPAQAFDRKLLQWTDIFRF